MIVATLPEIQLDAPLMVADRRQPARRLRRRHAPPVLPRGRLALGGRQLARVVQRARRGGGQDHIAPVGGARRGRRAGHAVQRRQGLPRTPAAVDARRRDPMQLVVVAQRHGGRVALRRHHRNLRHAHAAQRLPALPGAVMALLVGPHAAQRIARHQARRAVGMGIADQRPVGAAAQTLPAALARVPAIDGRIGLAGGEHHQPAAPVGVKLRRDVLARYVIGALHPGGGRAGRLLAAARPGAVVVVVPGVVLEDHRLAGDLGRVQVAGAFLAGVIDIAGLGVIAGHAQHGLAHQPRAGDMVGMAVSAQRQHSCV